MRELVPVANHPLSPCRRATTIQIRSCRLDDFDGVLPLLRQLWPAKPIDPERSQGVFARAVASSNQQLFCAEADGSIVGFCSLTIKNNLWQEGVLGHVDELVVDDRHRGKGIGGRLLDHAIARARAEGCRRVELDSAFHRKEAHAFYERRGFENRAYLFSLPLTN